MCCCVLLCVDGWLGVDVVVVVAWCVSVFAVCSAVRLFVFLLCV